MTPKRMSLVTDNEIWASRHPCKRGLVPLLVGEKLLVFVYWKHMLNHFSVGKFSINKQKDLMEIKYQK